MDRWSDPRDRDEDSRDVEIHWIEFGRAGVSKLDGIDVAELPGFLKLAQELDPDTVTRFCRAINRSFAADKWPRLFSERAEVRRGARQVLSIISQNSEGETKDLADSLLAESPRRRRAASARGSGKERTSRRRKQKR